MLALLKFSLSVVSPAQQAELESKPGIQMDDCGKHARKLGLLSIAGVPFAFRRPLSLFHLN